MNDCEYHEREHTNCVSRDEGEIKFILFKVMNRVIKEKFEQRYKYILQITLCLGFKDGMGKMRDQLQIKSK